MATPAYAQRIESIDALRGFALFGLFIVHMLELFELYWAHPVEGGVQGLTHDIVFTLFAGKAFALLALCFGLSFHIIMSRAERRGEDFTGRFVWRMALLWLIGLAHCVLYRGDVLEVLAVMGLAILPAYRLRSSRLLGLIAVVLLAQPMMIAQFVAALAGADWANQPPRFWSDKIPAAYLDGGLWETLKLNITTGRDFKWLFMAESGRISQILGLGVLGLLLGRIGFFTAPARFAPARRIGLVVALAAAVGLYFGRAAIAGLVPAGDALPMPRPIAEAWLSALFDLSVTGVLALGFVALSTGAAYRVLRPLAPAGRMTLTLYLLQSAVFVPVFYGFGLGAHATMSQTDALWIGLAAFALQLWLARLWFGRFLYGPMEWLWRAATYGSLKVPFVRRA